MKKLFPMRDALADPLLLADALRGPSWDAWRILLIAAVGEELTEDERAAFKQFTGRDHEPGSMIDTWLTVSGRRSGKTTALAVLVVYLACLCDWSDDLSLGERGVALYLAPTQDQAKRAFRYARAFINHSPLIKKLVTNEVADSIELSNGIDVEIQAANWRHVRGVTCIAVVLDECAFLRNAEDSQNKDTDLITALRPSLVTTNGPMLLISSPGTDQGVVYTIHRQNYGAQGDPLILVCQADSKALNPKLDQARIDREYSLDAESAQAEWGGQFRAPVSVYLSRPLVERAVKPGQQDWPYEQRYIKEQLVQYVAFADMASGDGKDSATLAIGHRDYSDSQIVIDCIREIRPPFNSEDAVRQFAEVLRLYKCGSVVGDQYAKGWCRTAFARYGIDYTENAPIKSDIYLHCVPLFTADKVLLPDNPRLVSQLCGLRRKVGQGGKETVDHLRNGHDDVANAVCGVLYRKSPVYDSAGAMIAPIIMRQPFVPGYERLSPDNATSPAAYMASFHVGTNQEYGTPGQFDHPIRNNGGW
jgi:hypothetical protein